MFSLANILRRGPQRAAYRWRLAPQGLGSAYGYREAVTRELNRLTKMGIIEQRSRMLWIKDLLRLEALVRDAGGE